MNEVSKSKFFWEEFSAGKLNLRVALGRLEISDAEKDELCQVWSAVGREDEEASRGGRGAPVGEVEMMAIAWAELKVPYWYVRWWYCEMAKMDWMTSHGLQIDVGNWKRLLAKWWANVREDMREWMRQKYEWHEAREEKSAAVVASESEVKVPRIAKASDWAKCAEMCSLFREGRCLLGRTPPSWRKMNPGYACNLGQAIPFRKAFIETFPEPHRTRDLVFYEQYFAQHPEYATKVPR